MQALAAMGPRPSPDEVDALMKEVSALACRYKEEEEEEAFVWVEGRPSRAPLRTKSMPS